MLTDEKAKNEKIIENENNNAIEYQKCDFGIKFNQNNENKILLKDLNLIIKKGELVTIIGETGTGKSCLINSILHNLELLNRKILLF